MTQRRERIVVLDFGSQYAHLIAKRLRLLGYYSEIALPSVDEQELADAKGIVLSGGPASVYDKDIPECNEKIFDLDIPLLGLCYGHQLMSRHYGGDVESARTGEFGIAFVEKAGGQNSDVMRNSYIENPLFSGIDFPAQVWMSHQDEVLRVPSGFEITASTKDCRAAALADYKRQRYSLQFHIEVKDTPCGEKILENFAQICGMSINWNQDAVLDEILRGIKQDAKDKNVLLFLSGGVDSTVAFALLNKALGNSKVLGLHIDNGFMRKNESSVIAARYTSFGFTNFIVEDASERFLAAIEGEVDPQKKRHAVGETFIRVRDEVVMRAGLDENKWLLAQGTLYPDIIESGGTKNAHTIKTHHNRVEGIQALIEKGLIIEPLKDLYKDEVRLIGKKIGLPDELVMRHPFPGPGLSINVLCSHGELDNPADYECAVKNIKAFPSANFFDASCSVKLFVLPVKSVGVQGDFRTYRFPCALMFNTHGAVAALPSWDALEAVSSALTNGVSNVNRAVVQLYRRTDCAELRLQKGYCDKPRLDQTREVDAIVLEELKAADLYRKIFQHLTINLPFASRQDRTSFVLRPVVSEDVMTARFARLDRAVLERIVERIALLPFVDALYYDITNKPPATFGWE